MPESQPTRQSGGAPGLDFETWESTNPGQPSVPPGTKPSFLKRLRRRQESTQPRFLRIHNLTRQTEIGNRIEVADTAARRNRGLLGRTGLDFGEGLWIVPCEAVHTFAMKFPLDLIYLDRNHKVVKVRESVRPSRISGALRAHSVIELPTGIIAVTRTRLGDQLQLEGIPAPQPQ